MGKQCVIIDKATGDTTQSKVEQRERMGEVKIREHTVVIQVP